MTTTLEPPVTRVPAATATRSAPLANVGPNWFATVMGTGGVATAAATLPVHGRALRSFAEVAWLIALLLLVAVTTVTVVHRRLHPEAARAHLRHPVIGNFYGAAPMALLTVGTGAVLVGRDLIGLPAALRVGWGCWAVGTVGGLACAAVLPRRTYALGTPVPAWLMPVVPPMVSAAAGGVLVVHLAPGPGRQTMLAACWVLFGLALVAALVVTARVVRQVASHGVGPAALVPTLWILLGPLGQSITAAHALGTSEGGHRFALVYGSAAWLAAVSWLGFSAVATWRVRPPFGLPWWSLTFPVGTVVTGTSALFAMTGLTLFSVSAVGLFVGLVGAWVVVAASTARHSRRLLA